MSWEERQEKMDRRQEEMDRRREEMDRRFERNEKERQEDRKALQQWQDEQRQFWAAFLAEFKRHNDLLERIAGRRMESL